MSCEEFLKKWSFLPPIRYCFGIYSLEAFYISTRIELQNEDLNQLLLDIDTKVQEASK